jgi:hypothetical protein
MSKQMVAAEYWRHRPTGEIWAVRLVNGAVIGACGPLADSYVTRELLHYLPYSQRDATWVKESLSGFVVENGYGRLP